MSPSHLLDRAAPARPVRTLTLGVLLSFPFLVLLFVAVAFALPGDSSQPFSASSCARVAAPGGSDSAAGTAAAPFASAQRLADSLRDGEVGCLRAGTYTDDVRFPTAGVTLRSYPGERATVRGRMWIPRGSDRVTVAGLDLDGRNADNLPSPTINASDATFVDDDVHNDNTAICFVVGGESYGRAVRSQILNNRIHECGVLPAANHDHGIYLAAADDTKIIGNWIYDNADRGIQFYPDAQRTYVAGNVIDGNGQGVIFSGDDGKTSNDNVVENNVITNSNIRSNVESFYPDGNPVGKGNVVRNNCIGGGTRDRGNGAIAPEVGFRLERNVITVPRYADRGAKDFRLDPSSQCGAVLGGAPVPSVPSNASGGGAGTRGATTGSSGTPGSGTSSGSSPTGFGATTGKGKITLKLRKRAGGRVKISGSVQRGGGVSAAATGKAIVQIQFDGDWYPLRSMAVKRNRFGSDVRLPAQFRGRVVKMRVLVGAVGRSSVARVRG